MAAATQQDSVSKSDSHSKSKSKRHRHKHHDKKDMRTIGRWYIGETLGKGGYSWVKKGYDKKTGKCVALKFMAKADESWVAEQSKQVVTEIESLKQIRHSNVMKLYAYNLNARYPSKDEKTGKETTIDTILLVLEYAPGGELFDILYYTSALEEIVARTYFRQIIAGLEACHNAGVAHRDLKPQNLLLDSRFNIKITDFGLSKLFESDADAQMKTTYVGTRGYQAPELLLDKSYDLSCDIFSIGVVLFILMTGYPPFEQATDKDRWYKSMTKKNYEVFWKAHRASPLANNKECKDLLQKMLAYEPKERISIADIKKHAWYNGKYLEGKDLIRALRNRHREMEAKRKKDSRKQADLQTSVKNRDINFRGAVVPPLLPDNVDESVGLLHTTEDWQDVYNMIEGVMGSKGGTAVYDKETMALKCTMKMGKDVVTAETFEFFIQIFISRVYNTPEVFEQLDKLKEEAIANNKQFLDTATAGANDVDAGDNAQAEMDADRKKNRKKTKAVYAVRIKRTRGDELKFTRTIRMQLLMTYCGGLFSGVPKSRLAEIQGTDTSGTNAAPATTADTSDEKTKDPFDDIDFLADDDESDGDYDNILKNEGLGLDSNQPAAVVAAGGADDAKVDS